MSLDIKLEQPTKENTMILPETIEINGIEYAPVTDTTPTERQIVVADRGWVFVGNTQTDDTGDITITNASTIRRWGTTSGLGQLALSGPTEATKLDAAGTVRIPARSVVAVFNVTPGVWK